MHQVRGVSFGRVAGPAHPAWSAVVSGALSDIAADLTDAGLDATDVEVLLVLAAAHQSVLDEIDEPRLLHGDLWTVNVMVAIDGDEPRVTGVLDSDRTLWGDPLADWTVFMIRQRPPADEKAFWAGYGPPPTETAETRLREFIYRARIQGEIRLELQRLHRTEAVAHTYPPMAEIVQSLRTYR